MLNWKTHRNTKLKNLVGKSILGQGSYAKVYRVYEKYGKDGQHYALKVMIKDKLLEDDMLENVFYERDVMKMVHHPFLNNMLATFEYENSIYILLDELSGGELKDRIDLQRKLPVESAKFYAACIVEGLDHLHLNSIVHRDVKPENIMINDDGYAVLIDFGMGKYT